jgi:PilZ domain
MTMGLMNSQFRKVAPASIERRMTTREAVSVRQMTVGRRSKKPQDAQLSDLSKYGCRIIVSANFSVGENVLLGFLDAAPVAAVIVWHDDQKFGCRFDHEMDLQLFRQLALLTG